MKLLFTLSCFLSCCFGLIQADQNSTSIRWFTNYDEGMRQARTSSKPVLILFTGSDWCTWCKKLEQEVLDRPEFAASAGDKFVFIKIDFPMNKKLPADQTARNKQLQKEYGVSGFPTLVMLDSQQQKQIGTVGYRPGGPKAYSDYVLQMVGQYGSYQKKVSSLSNQPLPGVELKQLYEQATTIGRHEDAMHILEHGISSDQEHFFMLEQYRLFAEKGRLRNDEAIRLRQTLLSYDPNNLKLTHYQIAVIDFEALSRENGNENPELTVASLVEYTEKFGNQDKDNLWRLQMIISQVFFDQNNLPEALRYAQRSFQSAPPAAQPEIASAIRQMQAAINN